jgi:hypothetical protein
MAGAIFMSTVLSKRLVIELLVLVALIVTGAVIYWPESFKPKKPNLHSEPERAFAGSSELLKQTVVLPTLDTSIPDKKSAIWCISIQLAWNRLKNDITKEPVKLTKGQEIADRLNNSEESESDMASADFLAMAGRVKVGIVQKIEAGLAQKFPQNTMPPIQSFPGGVVAFGYVKADVRYEYQFLNNPEWLSFKGSDGVTVPVRSFGLPEKRHPDLVLEDALKQVRVLYRDGGKFAVDLSYQSSPYQIVLAKMPRKASLAETLTELNEKIAASKPFSLKSSMSLLVPNMDWRVEHNFTELQGMDKLFLNDTMAHDGPDPIEFLAILFQFVDFKMNRTGASVRSGSYLATDLLNGHEHEEDTNPDHYHFDRPFLIVMKKRDSTHPFFVMWVDNAELLCKR